MADGFDLDALDLGDFPDARWERTYDPPLPSLAAETITATPWVWVDPRTLPLREWLYGYDLIRRFLTVTVSPGGVGKTSLVLAEALAMVTGRDLLGVRPTGDLRCWLWNGEDPLEELQRRVAATMIHYEISPEDVGGRLFIDSGRDTEIVIAVQERNGIKIAVPVVDALVATIRRNAIDVLVIDPFVSAHSVSENDNGAINRVAKTFGRIAEQTGCAIHLVHHVKKLGGQEAQIEDSRGAVALIAACRVGRVLNPMTKEEGERFGVEKHRLHFRVTNGKLNLAPPPERSDWYRLASVDLGNGPLNSPGDSIGVVTPWMLPNPLDDVTVHQLREAQRAVSAGRWRENIQAKDWVGYAISKSLGMSPASDGKLLPSDRAKVRGLLKAWMSTGMFVVVEGLDEHREKRSFVEVGEQASD